MSVGFVSVIGLAFLGCMIAERFGVFEVLCVPRETFPVPVPLGRGTVGNGERTHSPVFRERLGNGRER